MSAQAAEAYVLCGQYLCFTIHFRMCVRCITWMWNFYRYYIGREDQSVNEKVMISRVDQQIFVTKCMIDMYDMRKISNKKLRTYMTNYLAIMMTVSSILLIRSKNAENLEKKRELWQYLKKNHYRTYWKIRYGILGQTMNLPGRSGRKISSLAYIVARRIVGFN